MRQVSGMCKVCNNKRSGEESDTWKGGRTKHSSGYVQVKLPSGKYQMEHRYVMEQFLGRELLPGENVHHINGIRDDNRIENLELWCRPQPIGIRATDALAWAYEVIALYKDVPLGTL